ncbi:MAG: cofactor-independent phosphoglycerate mutase [Planctomycetes bacterium]|nr:cofactor-independent phosphoglycerate mutase [Planctomycetota bacterium]
MRYALVIPDGAADTPCAELAGKTPLEAAHLPALQALAREGRLYYAQTVPAGCQPGSDVACLSVLGYDPAKYYTGRAPLEAAAMNLEITDGQAVFRANTVTIVNGIMKDYSAGHISTEEASEVITYLDRNLGVPGVAFYPGVQYRHACVVDGAAGKISETTPPHDILEQATAPHLPKGGISDTLCRVMERSIEVLAENETNRQRIAQGKLPVTQIWLWGGGTPPQLESYQELFGISGGLISAVNLLNGIAMLAGLEVLSVENITGYYDTNYAGKGRAALEFLARSDFVAVHVEAPDEAGHNGEVHEKIRALENIDQHIIAPLLAEAHRSGDLRILVTPDHPTPIALRTHTAEPVPACLWGPGIAASGGGVFSEQCARESGSKIPGCDLIRELTA